VFRTGLGAQELLLPFPSVSPRNTTRKSNLDGARSRAQWVGELVLCCGSVPRSSVGSTGPSLARHWEEEMLHPHLKLQDDWFGRAPPKRDRENPENILPRCFPYSDITDTLLSPSFLRKKKDFSLG